MAPVVKEIVVARPPMQVFAALVEPRQRAAWSTTFLEEPLPQGAAVQVGTRIRATRRGSTSGSRYELTVTALDPGRRLAMALARNGKRVAHGAFELEPVPGGTRVRSVSELELSGLQRVMEPVLAQAAAKEMESELASLKRHVESSPLA